MSRQWRVVSFAIAAVCVFQISTSFAATETKSLFDLPAEPLDKALRDFAIQAKRNISYQPSLVAGHQAPAVKGEYTPVDVLAMLLTGTQLRAVNVNDNTVEVVVGQASTSRGGDPAANTEQRNDEKAVHIGYLGADAAALPASTANLASNQIANADVEATDRKEIEEITVTGSHIRGVSSASPVIEIGREEIERSGYTSISELMLSVPQNFGGGYNPGSAVGNNPVNSRFTDNPTGASVPNLRGLGPGSTLTLIDGHRMASGLTGGGADISSIPLDAIERVEVVTDSASSIYGSDAVAGVVNIILKRNYEGAKTSLSYGVATQGGGTVKQASQTFGTAWSTGSLTVAYEHTQQDLVDAKDRAFTSSSLDPYSLLPQTRSNSLTVSATQDVSTTVSAFVDALLVGRNADSFVYNGLVGTPLSSPAALRKYAITSGIDFTLWNDWKLSAYGNAAEDRTETNSGFLGDAPYAPGKERAIGSLRNVEVNANGRVFTLPSGPLGLALGAGYRKEGFSDALGTAGSAYTQQPSGARSVRYAFGELLVPLAERSQRFGLEALDMILSVRSERYSDFGSKTVPKVGFVYEPTGSVKVRATWGKAFKAPNLNDIDQQQQLVILALSDPASTTGNSNVLIKAGGNPNLKPETADAWTAGVDYSPPEINDLHLSTTVFDIKYTNRISQIANPFAALTDAQYAFFVMKSPSVGVAQSLYDAYPANEVFNATGAPFSIESTGAILDDRLVNVARQTARGADLSGNYKFGTKSNATVLFANIAYLDLTEQDGPQAPTVSLSGLAFYPAKLRARGGTTWTLDSWALTGTVNYLGREMNTQVTPVQSVGSWTTVDASLRYAPTMHGVLSGIHISLAAVNVFDRNPPRLIPPLTVGGPKLDYDASNTSPLGRFISLSMSKEW